jgi:hypothetical protein
MARDAKGVESSAETAGIKRYRPAKQMATTRVKY